jgi:hypothetical protein
MSVISRIIVVVHRCGVFRLTTIMVAVVLELAAGVFAALNYRQGAAGALGSSLTRVEYSYDCEGNRLTAVRSPRPSGGLVSGTRQEQDNSYDIFNRLIASEFTHFDSGNTPSLLRNDSWQLDLLGNWILKTEQSWEHREGRQAGHLRWG